MRFFFLASLGLLAAASACTTAGPARPHAAFWRTNGYDRQGREQGRWRSYFDDQKQTRLTTGRYRHGQPVGRWHYYTPLGTLDHKERYRRGYSDITFYHPNGQISQQGRARVADEGTVLHYFWFGEWRKFSDTGRLVEIDTYEKGKQVASHPIQDM